MLNTPRCTRLAMTRTATSLSSSLSSSGLVQHFKQYVQNLQYNVEKALRLSAQDEARNTSLITKLDSNKQQHPRSHGSTPTLLRRTPMVSVLPPHSQQMQRLQRLQYGVSRTWAKSMRLKSTWRLFTPPSSPLPTQSPLKRSLHISFLGKMTPPKPFKLTDIGEGIVQVELTKWHVKPGDIVKEFDVLCVVQSDKATVEITSRYAGKVRALGAKEGEMVKVGSMLVEFEDDSTSTSSSATPSLQAASQSSQSSSSSSSSSKSLSSPPATSSNTTISKSDSPHLDKLGPYSDKIEATPAVRHLAKENNLDISKIQGTGKGGRVTKEDVLVVLGMGVSPSRPLSASPHPSSSPAPPSLKTSLVPAPSQKPTSQPSKPVVDMRTQPTASSVSVNVKANEESTYRIPMRGIRREMGKVMSASLRIPHLNLMEDIQVDRAEAMAKDLKSKGGTMLALLVKAASLALLEFPELNALNADADANEIIVHKSHFIGVAMDTPRGLIVPSVSAVESRSLLEIANELTRLRNLALEGKLGPSDLQQPTFSLSNIGSIGGSYASPVIAPPQVAMGVFGRTRRVPVFTPEPDSLTVIAVKQMPVTWAADHRVIDGATVAKFSNRFKALVERPAEMLGGMR